MIISARWSMILKHTTPSSAPGITLRQGAAKRRATILKGVCLRPYECARLRGAGLTRARWVVG
jgi:hypothetical protein